MRILLAVVLLLGFLRPAYANLDYKCMSTCTQSGTSAPTCIPRCTYTDLPSSGPALQGTDYQCRSRCVSQGYMFGYCSAICTPAPGTTLKPNQFQN